MAQTQGLPAFLGEWSVHAVVRLRTADLKTYALLVRMITRDPGRHLIDTRGHADATPCAQNFQSTDRPALVMNGEFQLDSRKRFARRIASQLPEVECVELPGAGHLSNLDNPGAYGVALRGFPRRHAFPATSH